MTTLHCNHCGHEYASSEVQGTVDNIMKRYLKIIHNCPKCNFKNETLFLPVPKDYEFTFDFSDTAHFEQKQTLQVTAKEYKYITNPIFTKDKFTKLGIFMSDYDFRKLKGSGPIRMK